MRDQTGQTGSGVRLRPSRRHASRSEDCVRALTEAIEGGTFPPGSQLPSETDLAAQLNVSRATVREALRTLEDRRLIIRRHGLGTFVLQSVVAIEKDLRWNSGVTAMIRAAGYEPRTVSLRNEVLGAGDKVAEILGLEAGAEIVRWDRLRLVDDRPVVHSIEIVSREFIADDDIAASLKDDTPSLLRLLYERSHVAVARAHADLMPVKASAENAELLKVEPDDPLMRIEQVDYDDTGRPVVYSVGYYVSDLIRFTVERIGPGEIGND